MRTFRTSVMTALLCATVVPVLRAEVRQGEAASPAAADEASLRQSLHRALQKQDVPAIAQAIRLLLRLPQVKAASLESSAYLAIAYAPEGTRAEAEALAALAAVRVRLGDLDHAEVLLRAALEVSPADPALRSELASVRAKAVSETR